MTNHPTNPMVAWRYFSKGDYKSLDDEQLNRAGKTTRNLLLSGTVLFAVAFILIIVTIISGLVGRQ